jgi:predicted RNA-binding Zn-ribbon protein involved in translation (DUF1610 family)
MAGRSEVYGLCPTCGAREGVDCKRPSGHRTYPSHVERPVRWPCPVCGDPVLERDWCQYDGRVFTHNRCLDLADGTSRAVDEPAAMQEVLF